MYRDREPVGGKVVIIDDDEAARESVGQMLDLRGYKIKLFSSAEAALSWAGIEEAGCVITDVKMPGMDGEQLLFETKRRRFCAPVIMITGHGDVAMAVRCLKAGAFDFVEKPFEEDILIASVMRAVETSKLRKESVDLKKRLKLLEPGLDGRHDMVGRSRIMQDLYDQIDIVAKSEATVLICGETGVGKELVARAIHQASGRSDGPFIPLNAGALPETMLESELFGHAKGAFTGAVSEREGALITATGGTLLLDEIESISHAAQVRLLRVLEDGMVHPLGRDTPRKIDARLLVTSKANLSDEVKMGRMRGDFYHRIMVLTIAVPPLRERVDDIPLLILHFLRVVAQKNGIPVPEIPEHTMSKMMSYSWPGNVRELKNTVERMVITSHGGATGPFMPDEGLTTPLLLSLPSTQGRLRDEMEKTEREVIDRTLHESGGEINATYKALGISRRALYERMKKYGMEKEDYKT
jgi:two-component system C4-dicarboxylate transport response regulator DctD